MQQLCHSLLWKLSWKICNQWGVEGTSLVASGSLWIRPGEIILNCCLFATGILLPLSMQWDLTSVLFLHADTVIKLPDLSRYLNMPNKSFTFSNLPQPKATFMPLPWNTFPMLRKEGHWWEDMGTCGNVHFLWLLSLVQNDQSVLFFF